MKSELPFLAGCECKGTTSFWNHQIFGEVFLPIDFRLSEACIKQTSKLALWASQSAIVVTNLQSCIEHFRPPFLWSCGCKVTTTFWNHQIFGEVFFWEPHPCVWHLLYIGVPRSHLRGNLLYIGVPRSHSRGYLLLYIAPYPLESEPSTKKLTSSPLVVKTCSPLKALQTPPKTRSFELRVQRYYNFPNPPNFRRSFFSRASSCVWHLLYIGVPRSHLRGHLLYIGVPRSNLRGHLLHIGVPRSHLRGHLLWDCWLLQQSLMCQPSNL